MNRKVQTGILAASVVAACVVGRAQTNVYTLSVGSYLNITGDAWVLTKGWSSSSQLDSVGFSQFQKVHYPELFSQAEAIPHSTYTVLYYGPHSLSLRAPAWVLGLGGVLIGGLLSWLAAGAISGMRE